MREEIEIPPGHGVVKGGKGRIPRVGCGIVSALEGMSTSRLQNIVAAMGLLVGGRQAGTRRPEVPPSVQASAGEEVVLAAQAKGVQIYVCQEGPDQKLTWVLKRPEAELTDATERTIALHSAGSTWKHVDGSEVMGKVVAKEDAPKPEQFRGCC